MTEYVDPTTPQTTVEMLSISKARYDELMTELSNANARVTGLESTLRHFKQKVRDAVIVAKSEHNLCNEGTNEFLSNLGLETLSFSYDVDGWLEGEWTLSVWDKGISIDDIEVRCKVPFIVRIDGVASIEAASEQAKNHTYFDDFQLNWDAVLDVDSDTGCVDDESELVEYMGGNEPNSWTLGIRDIERVSD